MARDAGELVSKPVMNTAEGKQLGRVKDAIFDPEAHALYGLVVTTESGDMFLDRSTLRGLGSQAVTVESDDVMTPISMDAKAKELMDSGIHFRGSKVITQGGDSLGTLDKIMLGDDGQVEYYESSTGILGLGEKHEVRPSQVMKIGTDAIIVSDEALQDEEDRAKAQETASSDASARFQQVTDGVSPQTRPSGPISEPDNPPRVQTDVGDITAIPPAANDPTSPTDALTASGATYAGTELEGTITSGESQPTTPLPGTAPDTATPAGTDPSKETLVVEPDSQPGNLIDDEKGVA